jgi:hypothetical protein
MTKKLRLDVADLQVEGFSTHALTADGGTVHGFFSAQCTGTCNSQLTCIGATCDGQATCGGGPTCDAESTCARSCGLCNTYYCGSGDPSCADGDTCLYTCAGSCNEYATCATNCVGTC